MMSLLRLLILALTISGPALAHMDGMPQGPSVPSGFRAEAMTAPEAALGLAQIRLVSTAEGYVTVRARVTGPDPVTAPIWPLHCIKSVAPVAERLHNGWRLTETRHCDAAQGAILFPWRVEAARTIVMRNGDKEEHFLRAGGRGVAVPMELVATSSMPFASIATRYFAAGVHHILGGADHLALILCLLLLARGRLLVLAVTAFTLGHSLSLALGALGMVRVPAIPVEACIALSIVVLARQVVLAQGLRDRDLLPLVGIGLLHGLGFAGMLGEFGLPTGPFLLALLSFNLGIEAGQLAFIAVLAVGWRLGMAIVPTMAGFGRVLVAPAVGTIAAFWTLQRLALMG
ncbi:HupE/UreJ family protein [Meridianimarinicoccus sp. MJW13]|uniref:HupE/UreJ family protein n=1 Tax=Meridianimarinicoccus sp. MJW13 TaxID=2720031 RepID=UPI001865C530|nr:HupE/UreJ family protein [Fluviibacterium sp. MJW13]